MEIDHKMLGYPDKKVIRILKFGYEIIKIRAGYPELQNLLIIINLHI